MFVSQPTIILLLMTMMQTSGTGLIASEESISIKSTPKLRDWLRRPLGGKEGRANRRGSRKSKATESSMRGCRGSTKSIWHERRVKKKRLGWVRSAGTRKAALLLLTPAHRLAAQSWATTTSPGQLHEERCRRWSM